MLLLEKEKQLQKKEMEIDQKKKLEVRLIRINNYW